jgi:pyruvate dehydrogenase E1 component
MGAVLPEALAAAEELERGGVAVDVAVVTSGDLLFRALRARSGLGDGEEAALDAVLPADRAAPLVTVLDGHPHTLAFLGLVRGVPVAPLGVDRLGQSGDVAELYEHHGIDADTIAGAAADLLDR